MYNQGVSMKLLIFSLMIIDASMYQEYRNQIKPVMERHGITVKYEYTIDSVISSQQPEDRVNRLAVFEYSDQFNIDTFFNDPEYQNAKPLLLASSENVTVILK